MSSSEYSAVVLLVDDQPMVGEMVRRSLAGDPDVLFEYCSDPTKAVETALRIKPTVVLQDLVMPQVSGLTLVRFFRRHPELQSVPIVVMSSNEDPADKAEVFAAGANDYLVKPPHRIELLARIRYHSEAYRSQQRLVELNARLEDVSRAKGEFLATMSHEIRTPLNGILGVVQLLEHTPLNPQQESYLETIRSSGKVLLAVINDILDVSKVESGKLVLENIGFEMTDLLEDVLRLMGPTAQEKGLTLSGYLAPTVPARLIGDPVRLRQVLFNLVSNALKFTHQGEVTVTVKGEPVSDGQAAIAIEVRDSGIGISPEAQQRLFSPFSQADGSTTRKYGGSGLGLVIVRQLARLMGDGEATLQSEVGVGSVFTVRVGLGIEEQGEAPAAPSEPLRLAVLHESVWAGELAQQVVRDLGLEVRSFASLAELQTWLGQGEDPAALLLSEGSPSAESVREWAQANGSPSVLRLTAPGMAQHQPWPISAHGLAQLLWPSVEDTAPATEPSQPSIRPSGPLTRLLVAEDNPINQVIIEGLLEHLGYACDIAGDGNEVVRRALAGDYPVVLMDVEMPGQDGYEATRELRSRGYQRPIVAMTAYAMAEDRQRCLDAGMDDFLTKPIELPTLGETVGRWLQSAVASRP